VSCPSLRLLTVMAFKIVFLAMAALAIPQSVFLLALGERAEVWNLVGYYTACSPKVAISNRQILDAVVTKSKKAMMPDQKTAVFESLNVDQFAFPGNLKFVVSYAFTSLNAASYWFFSQTALWVLNGLPWCAQERFEQDLIVDKLDLLVSLTDPPNVSLDRAELDTLVSLTPSVSLDRAEPAVSSSWKLVTLGEVTDSAWAEKNRKILDEVAIKATMPHEDGTKSLFESYSVAQWPGPRGNLRFMISYVFTSVDAAKNYFTDEDGLYEKELEAAWKEDENFPQDDALGGGDEDEDEW